MWYFLSFLYSHQGAPKDNDEERGSSGTHLFGTVLVSSIITADGGEQLYVTEQPRCLTITKPAGKVHPIPKMRLGVFRVYGIRLNTEAYRTMLSRYSTPRGANQQRNSIGHII